MNNQSINQRRTNARHTAALSDFKTPFTQHTIPNMLLHPKIYDVLLDFVDQLLFLASLSYLHHSTLRFLYVLNLSKSPLALKQLNLVK